MFQQKRPSFGYVTRFLLELDLTTTSKPTAALLNARYRTSSHSSLVLTFLISKLEQVDAILRNVSDRSLVIIDELGRGTSDEEGVGLCFAVSEHLIKSKAFTLFATHFQDLHELSNMYYSVAS